MSEPKREKQPPYNDKDAQKANHPLTADEIVDFLQVADSTDFSQLHENENTDTADKYNDIDTFFDNFLQKPTAEESEENRLETAAYNLATATEFLLFVLTAAGIQSDKFADAIRDFTQKYKANSNSDTDNIFSAFDDTVISYMSELEINPEPGVLSDLYREVVEKIGERSDYNSVGAHRVETVGYPLDKPDSVIWSLLEENTHGQISLPIKAESNKGSKEIDILYSINFDVIESELPIIKRLTQYDKRVYVAAGALYNAGNRVITTSMIYRAMGYVGTPGAKDKEKIDKSFTKFTARITLDNSQEIKAGYNYPRFSYDGDLLPFERVKDRDVVNGQLVESTIHIFREPPLISFARGREQITSVPLKMLQSPISKTDANLAIEDYLIERIAHAKNGSQPTKILLSTLYDHAGIKTKMQRSRAPQKIKGYLDYYVKCNEIKGYTMDSASITLELNEPPKKKTKTPAGKKPTKKK